MPELAMLLKVQELDNTSGALRHRLATLTERQTLDRAQAAVAVLQIELSERGAPRRELETRQRRLEDEATSLRTKADGEDRRLYSGTVKALRELQAIQEEITHLRRRAAQLDEQTIELMMEIEPLVEALSGLTRRLADAESSATAATVALAEAQAAVDRELASVAQQRAEAAGEVPPEALTRYERRRGELAPSTVVRLVGSRCEGCPLKMPSVEADRIRHLPAGLDECDECGRLVLH